MAILGMKRTAIGWEAEHLPMRSNSSGFIFRHLFCLLCWSGDQRKVGEGCVDVQAVLYCCSTGNLCNEFLLCVQGAEGRVEQMEGRKTWGSFQCNDNAVLLLILYSCMALTALSLCCAVLGFFLPAGSGITGGNPWDQLFDLQCF